MMKVQNGLTGVEQISCKSIIEFFETTSERLCTISSALQRVPSKLCNIYTALIGLDFAAFFILTHTCIRNCYLQKKQPPKSLQNLVYFIPKQKKLQDKTMYIEMTTKKALPKVKSFKRINNCFRRIVICVTKL